MLIGLAAAVVLAPIAAALTAACGLRFPFPRIFDRTVMLTLAVSLLCLRRPLALGLLVRRAFAQPSHNFADALKGFLLALTTIAILFAVAAIVTPGDPLSAAAIARRAARYLPAAVAIALLEEAFFRAILLAGMTRDFGRRTALLSTSAIYALAHLVRSPARFYVTGFVPLAGLHDLAAALSRIVHPGAALPTLLGLFLLGLVLGIAFLITQRVYASAGIHAGFVLGAKTWPLIAHSRPAIPHWLAGSGPVPLIAAPAAWLLALLLITLLPAIFPRQDESDAQ